MIAPYTRYRRRIFESAHRRAARAGRRFAAALLPLLLCTGAGLQSCNLVERGNTATADSSGAELPEVDTDALREALRGMLVAPDDSTNPLPSSFAHYGVMYRHYITTELNPVWTASFAAPAPMDTLLHFLEAAHEHGLHPSLYGVTQLRELRKRFLASTAAGGDGDYRTLAKLELALSDAALSYASHMQYGALDPRSVFPNDYFHAVRERRIDDAVLRSGAGLGAYLRSLEPRDARYGQFIAALRRVRALQRTGPVTPITFPGSKIEPGQQSALLGQIERRIKYLSQLRLDETQPLPEQQFTSKFDAAGYSRYDSVLADKVKEFQRTRGLLDDGVLGDRSFKAMNLTHEERIRGIELAMERMRWLRMPDSGKYVRVNVPEFYLYAVENGSTRIRMKVCVGMRYSVYVKGQPGKNYQTPMVSGLMHYIVLNPTWSVPPSIATRETYYQALKDSTYLRRHGYKVLMNNSEVDPTSIRWRDYKPDKLPFRFVQRPGEGNALGRIKFVFDNDFDIYLHDTPKRRPFTFASRTVSHGCIRIEEPLRMLDFVLTTHKTWPPQAVLNYLDVDRTTKWITLDSKIPVYVDYTTTWVDERGVIQFRDDVYGKDKRIAAAMDRRLAAAQTQR